MNNFKQTCHHQGRFIDETECEGAVRNVFQGYYIEIPPKCGYCDIVFEYANLSGGWVHPYYKEDE